MAAEPRDLRATCQDYNSSDESDGHDSVVADFRKRSPVAQGQSSANVAAKRSHPSDLGADKSPRVEKVVNIDLQSDSGYSSHTAATMSSADSAPSAKSHSPPIAVAEPVPVPHSSPAIKRRPTISDRREDASPRKPPHRSGSISSSKRPSRERRSTVSEECTVAGCTKCGPNARSRRPPAPSPLDSGLDISYAPFDQRDHRPPRDQRSQRSAPTYVTPQSPTHSRQQPAYRQGPAVVLPAQSRRRSSSAARARPVSYHGGDSGQAYWMQGIPGGYPSPPQEYGPPPAASAHYNLNNFNQHTSQYMNQPYGGTPPNPSQFYNPGYGNPLQPSPPYDINQRPPMPHQSSSFQTRRPVSTFGPPLLLQSSNNNESLPSARYGAAPQSAKLERPKLYDESESSDYSSSDEQTERPRTRAPRAIMGPPAPVEKKKRRPSLVRRPNTTQVIPDVRSSLASTPSLPTRTRERESRPSRTGSLSRPNLVQHKAQSSFDTPRNSQVFVEDSKARRRQSYQAGGGYSREYHVDERRPRRRPTDADRNFEENMGGRNMRDQVDNVEAYQARTRGATADDRDFIKAAKKASSRVASGPSDHGDKKSRISQSNRTTVTNGNGGNGEIRLRVDASAPLSLSFNGDMEGRTLQFQPGDDGMADIVIGSARGNENTYKSERGSQFGGSKKSQVVRDPRREAEEVSVRSHRSKDSQSRRDGDRRPLRRKAEIRYDDDDDRYY